MFKNRKIAKFIAVFLLVTLIQDLFMPTISWALTAGPTAPEATSFEPVDTTDMVNLITGDFVYNTPLLEVPGPAGGYPLSLSYHAGIQPEEESSWVGLGWTLNAGAITRNVVGHPDDYKNALKVKRKFWEGGESKTENFGVNIGLMGTPLSLSAGMSISNDTYQGYGSGFSYGMGLKAAIFSMGVSGGTHAGGGSYGGYKLGLNIGSAVGKSKIQADIGTGSGGFSYSASLKPGGLALTGASLSSGKGLRPSLSVGGIKKTSATFSSSDLNVSTSGFSFSMYTPLPWLSFSYARKRQRYHINTIDRHHTNGAINNPITARNTSHFDDNDYDSREVTVFGHTHNVGLRRPVFLPLSFKLPNYDNYMVNAQGIGGSIRPYIFRNFLNAKNQKKDDDEYKQINVQLGYNSSPVEFRYDNDFANQVIYDHTDSFRYVAGGRVPFNYEFEGSYITGEQYRAGTFKNQKLAGSRAVNWFSNSEIIAENSKVQALGFRETNSSGFSREEAPGEQIGAFQIVNESGMTYHFSLPAYNKQEYFYSGNARYDKDGHAFNEIKRDDPYAYTWFLTAITGPDYVDRGLQGQFDRQDWGYWVEFDYGKWTDQYFWRNPHTGLKGDEDEKFKNMVSGTKELYYLDAIRTATHTALFVKEISHSGKSVRLEGQDEGYDSHCNPKKGFVPIVKGGSIPGRVSVNCSIETHPKGYGPKVEGKISYNSRPTSTLKLNQIMLFKNEVLKDIPVRKDTEGPYTQQYTYSWEYDRDLHGSVDCEACNGYQDVVFDQHLEQNVLDVHDLSGELATSLEKYSLSSTVFNTDYSLAEGTPNSFDYKIANRPFPSINPRDYPLKGKLALKSIQTLGQGGKRLIPPTRFDYGETSEVLIKNAVIERGLMNDNVTVGLKLPKARLNHKAQDEIRPGLLLKFRSVRDNHMGYARVIAEDTRYFYLEKPPGYYNAIATGEHKDFMVTTILPYQRNSTDDWNMHKTDPTMWSLTTIRTPIGGKIKIDMEPDEYSQAMVESKYLFPFVRNGDKVEIKLVRNGRNINIDEIFADGLPQYLPALYFYKWHDGTPIPVVTRATASTGLFVEGVNRENNSLIIRNHIKLEKVNMEIIAGNAEIPISKLSILNGGDLRVKSISIETADGISRQTLYDYDTGQLSSGFTTYEPVVIRHFDVEKAEKLFSDPHDWIDGEHFAKKYKRTLNNLINNIHNHDPFKINTHNHMEYLPTPGVMYSSVKVKERIKRVSDPQPRELPGYIEYKFRAPSLLSVLNVTGDLKRNAHHGRNINATYDGFEVSLTGKQIEVKDYTSRIGEPLSITHMNHEGDVINQKINVFLSDEKEQYHTRVNWINKTYHQQLFDRFRGQGIIQETWVEATMIPRYVNGTPRSSPIWANVVYHTTYPSVQVAQKTLDGKTKTERESRTLGFDFFSGRPVKTLLTTGFGDSIISEVTPAYHQYPGMGLVINGGKNMLTQEAQSMSYKVRPDKTPDYEVSRHNPKRFYYPLIREGLLSATIQTWSDSIPLNDPQDPGLQESAWKKHRVFRWDGTQPMDPVTGLYPITHFDENPFQWDDPSRANNPQWLQNGEVTLTDVYSRVLEVKDVNDHYSSTRMNNQLLVLASATNASYEEMAYSGAEGLKSNLFVREGGVHRGDGIPIVVESEMYDTYTKDGKEIREKLAISNRAHAGRRCLKLDTLGKAFLDTLRSGPKVRLDKPYHASVWVYYPGNAELADNMEKVKLYYKTDLDPVGESVHALPQKNKSGSWYLLNLDIYPDGANELYVGVENGTKVRSIYLDDFKLHPMDASMTSFVYDEETNQVTYILDNNGFYTHFEYDALGRLVRTTQETFNFDFGDGKEAVNADLVIQETIYNFKSND